MNININNTEIQLKYSYRAFIIYETIADESFNGKGLKELITMYYAVVMASNKDISITFDDFVDWLDESQTLDEFVKWFAEHTKVNKEIANVSESPADESAKKNN